MNFSSTTEKLSDVTIQSLPHEELVEEFANLKRQHEILAKSYEAARQELHESRMNSQFAAELKAHLTAEVESLQENEAKIRREHELKTESLLMELDAVKRERIAEAEAHTAAAEALRVRVRLLEEQEMANLDSHDHTTATVTDVARLGDDLKRSEERNVELQNIVGEYKTRLADCDELVAALKSQMKQFDEQIESLKCNLESKKSELSSVTEMLHSAQEDLCGANAELQNFKNSANPHAVKGNSLFAEVDDNRQEMRKALSLAKEKIHQLNRELLSKQAEVDALMCEKKTIWEDYAGQAKQHDASLNRAYERRITELEEQNDQLQREIAKWYENNLSSSSSDITQWVSGVLSYYREENHRLSNEFAACSVDNLCKEQKLRDLQRQLLAWRTKAVEANATVSQLETKLEVMENSKTIAKSDNAPVSDRSEELAIKKKIKNSPIERQEFNEKENFSPDYQVKISPNTEIRKPGILVTEPLKNKVVKKTTFQ